MSTFTTYCTPYTNEQISATLDNLQKRKIHFESMTDKNPIQEQQLQLINDKIFQFRMLYTVNRYIQQRSSDSL